MHMIREYQPDDAPAVLKLLQELGYELSIDRLLKRLEFIGRAGGIVYVYEIDRKVVGCINVIIDARLAEGIVAEIVSLVVSASCRGQTIGQQLVEKAEAWASPQVDILRVRCNVIRNQAHNFYQKQTFAEKKEQKVFEKKLI